MELFSHDDRIMAINSVKRSQCPNIVEYKSPILTITFCSLRNIYIIPKKLREYRLNPLVISFIILWHTFVFKDLYVNENGIELSNLTLLMVNRIEYYQQELFFTLRYFGVKLYQIYVNLKDPS